jgi:hypothetical protein
MQVWLAVEKTYLIMNFVWQKSADHMIRESALYTLGKTGPRVAGAAERQLLRRADIERIVQCDRPGLRIGLWENCVTECCTVVLSTASTMGVEPISTN